MTNKYKAHDVIRENRADGTILLRSRTALPQVVERTTDWLDVWANKTPDATFLAERAGATWREVTYDETRRHAQVIAAGLLELGLDESKPILILSGNSVDHGLLAMAAQYVGVPIVPMAEQYALIPDAHSQIDYVASLVHPGLVYAEDGDALESILNRPVFSNTHKLVSHGGSTRFIKLKTLAESGASIAERQACVDADTIAKILMTSGSTSAPKGVPTTHRMMCVNQAQIASALPFLTMHPPRIVDWLPWNHVFGGSHNFNMMLANGGALYIDGGKPVPHLIGQTLENLRLQTGTMAFNVPVGFAMIRDALKQDEALQQAYFKDLDMLFYAGASLPQDVWTDLETMARSVRGEMPLFNSSWGLTETAPAVLLQHQPTNQSGVIGVPLPGAELKLIPDKDMRCEVRFRGPNLFNGYLNQPKASANAFDEEGFFKTGDAMQFVDVDNVNLGLKFDGRIGEDFKLLSGTWVRASALRLQALGALSEIALDVIVTGTDRKDIGLLIVPSVSTRELDDVSEINGALIVPSLRDEIRQRLAGIGSSSSSRIQRVLFLAAPPSIAEGEITAKGNINFRKLLICRADLLDRLYNDQDEATVLIALQR